MAKNKKGNSKWAAYEEVRKPTPKPGFAFKSRKLELIEAELDSEMEEFDVDYKIKQRSIKNGKH